MNETTAGGGRVVYSESDAAALRTFLWRLRQEDLPSFVEVTDAPRDGADFNDEVLGPPPSREAVVLFLSEAALGTRWSSIDLSRQLIAVARDRSIRLRTVLLPGIREGVDHPLVKLPDSIDCRTTDLDDPVAVEEKASMIASGIRGERDDVEVLGVPFMVAAMTREQAHGLETGEALAGASVSPLEQQAAGMLLDELTRHDVEQLSSSYGDSPEDWRVPIGGNVPVRQAIRDVMRQINLDRDPPGLRPRFFSSEFLSADPRPSSRIWRLLEEQRGVLVIDAVSLFHPAVRSKLQQTALGPGPNLWPILVSPLTPRQAPLSRLIETLVANYLPMAFNRSDYQCDVLCGIGADGARQLMLRLHLVLPSMVDSADQLRPSPRSRRLMRSRGGDPRGVADVVFGKP